MQMWLCPLLHPLVCCSCSMRPASSCCGFNYCLTSTICPWCCQLYDIANYWLSAIFCNPQLVAHIRSLCFMNQYLAADIIVSVLACIWSRSSLFLGETACFFYRTVYYMIFCPILCLVYALWYSFSCWYISVSTSRIQPWTSSQTWF